MSFLPAIYKTHKTYIIAGIITFIILVGCSAWLLHLIKNSVRDNIQSNLTTIQNTSHEAVHYWRNAIVESTIGIANRSSIKLNIEKLLTSRADKTSLRKNSALAKLRKELKLFTNEHRHVGFFIVSPSNINYGSMRDSKLGEKNLLLAQDPEKLAQAFAGETVISRPLESDVYLEDKFGVRQYQRYSQFVITPVLNAHNRIIALLMFRLSPNEAFSRIFTVGRFGKSGETYAFNNQGLLLSPSRFEISLMQAGLIKPDSTSAYQLYLKQPGGDITKGHRPDKNYPQRPLTPLVSNTIKNQFHLSMDPIPDYRGVPTVGVGLWDAHEGLGFITQLDYQEAYASYFTARNVIILVTGVAALILLALIASLIDSREAAIRQVQKRTRQLKQQNISLRTEITERKKVEQSLQNSRIRTDALLNSAFDAIIATDENGEIELANPSAEKMFGYSKDELLGKNVRVLMPTPIRGKHDQLIQSHNTGSSSSIVGQRREMVACRKDGSTFPIELAVEETLFDNKKYFTSTINDISERKKLIERISASEKEYKSIVTNLSDTFYRTNQAGEIIMASPSAEQLLAYSLDELIGLKLATLYVDPQGQDRFLQALHENDGTVVDYEAQLRRKDGIVIWVSTNAHFYTNEYGNPLGVEGTTRDITARKLAEEELRDSRQRLSFHIHQTPLGVIEWDVDFKVIEWNPAAEKIFGYSRTEAIGRHAAELIIPDEFKPHMDDIWYSLLGRQGAQHSTNHNVNKQGQAIWCEWYNTPIVNDEMDVIGVASMVMDVTTRKKVEEILTRDHEQLEALVESRTEELNIARLEAEQANEAKSEFLANMSHELRTPMHTILSFAEMGMKKADRLSKQKLIQYFTNIHRGGERQLSLLNNLLDLSKLETGSTTYEFAEHDIQKVINEQIAQHELMLDKKHLSLKFDPGPVNSRFSFDRVRIEQVVRNLLSNAIKFSKEHSSILIQLGLGEIQQQHDTQPALLLSIEDEGVGIPKDELKTIFDKFAQSSKTRSKAGGTGLGLAICLEIITAHGGKIWAENTNKGGARFCFSLPLIQLEQATSIPESGQL